ncbi:MAG TPA: Rrf2 family transcriptional regulator [Bacteroidota bacterium]|nr:Rrf2 family transcriptional regulator [Bacteroidota bacterium]
MSLIFSRSCQYALQAVIYLSREREGAAVHVREISDALNIPHHFLGKILQILNRNGIVQSTKGANGGFRLGKPAADIRVLDIARSIDGASSIDRCVLGFPECDEHQPCPMHDAWKASKAGILRMLSETTVDELTGKMNARLDSLPGTIRAHS